MTNPLLIEIGIGVAGPLLTTAFFTLNKKAAVALADFVPGINKYSAMAKLVIPMIDPELAKHMDLLTSVEGSLKRLATGQASVPKGLSWARKIAGKILDSDSMMSQFLEALNEKFEVTEYNKLNAQTDGGYYRADDGEVTQAEA